MQKTVSEASSFNFGLENKNLMLKLINLYTRFLDL